MYCTACWKWVIAVASSSTEASKPPCGSSGKQSISSPVVRVRPRISAEVAWPRGPCLGTTRTMWSVLTSTLASRLMSVMRMSVMRSLLRGVGDDGADAVPEHGDDGLDVSAAHAPVVGIVEDTDGVRVPCELCGAGIYVAIRDVVAEFVGGAEGDPCDRASRLLRDIVGKVPGVRESSESLLGSIDLTLLIRPCTAIGLPALRARPPLLVLDGHVQTAVQIGNVAAHRLDQRRPDWPVFDASGHACGNAPRELIGETVEWGRA